MFLKSFLTAALIALVSLSASNTQAQSVATDKFPAPKIVVVNVDVVRAQSTAFIKARTQLEALKTDMGKVLQKEDKALRAGKAELSRKRTLLSPDKFTEERKAYEQRVAVFQRKVQGFQKTLRKVQTEAIGTINRKIVSIISKYAERNKVTLVLAEQTTILVAKRLNINAYVLKRLNKELPSVVVKKPAF